MQNVPRREGKRKLCTQLMKFLLKVQNSSLLTRFFVKLLSTNLCQLLGSWISQLYLNSKSSPNTEKAQVIRTNKVLRNSGTSLSFKSKATDRLSMLIFGNKEIEKSLRSYNSVGLQYVLNLLLSIKMFYIGGCQNRPKIFVK